MCGYGYTKDRYKVEVGKLESWGFECCRSRRGDNGKFWELWFLPYLRAAEGDLLRAMHSYCKRCGANQERGVPLDHPHCPNREHNYRSLGEPCGDGTMVIRDQSDHAGMLHAAIEFMMRYAAFGTLDVMVQRAYMSHE